MPTLPPTHFNVVNKFRKYKIVFFEIVGFCNARCTFCVTGKSNHPKGGIVEVEKFSQALSILSSMKLVDKKTQFCLFNWGEPTLHPELDRIIDILYKYDFKYALSTNAGKSIEYHSSWFENLSLLTISMCGFSQESYDKVHQFDFEKVKSNIISIVDTAKKSGFDTRKISIAHHIYQFNMHEVPMLSEFAKKLNVSYNPHYAYIADPARFRRYVNNTLSIEEMKSIASNLFCHYIDKRIQLHPRKGCRLFDDLTIDEECNIVVCCAMERDHPNLIISNIFDTDLKEKLTTWQPPGVCANCILTGISPLNEIGDSFPFPVELYSGQPRSVIWRLGKNIKNETRKVIRNIWKKLKAK